MSMKYNKMIRTALYYLISTIFAFVMVYPLFWLLSGSFKPGNEVFTNSYQLIPRHFTLSNYATGWSGFGGISFSVFFKNSFLIVVVSTIAQVFSSVLVAYGFCRIRFVGSKFWFGLMISTLLLPTQILLIPQYIIFNSLGLINSYWPLILPHFFGTPFFIFLDMQFIRGIPKELDEAAKIDGCSRFSVFFRIVIPLCVPALITSGIFAFYWKWDEFLPPLLYINKVSKYPVSLALRLFIDPSSVSNWGGAFAMSVLSLIPVFVIFVSMQKYLVEGISTTGLKG